jgi:hypothetical protein
MRLGATILLTYRGGDGRWRAGDSVVAWPTLADSEGGSQWLSGNGEGTYGKVVTLLVRCRKAYSGMLMVEGRSYDLELGKVAIEEMVGSFL